MAPLLDYVHLDDSTPCERSVTMAGGEWRCLTHGRRVRRKDEGMSEVIKQVYGQRIDAAMDEVPWNAPRDYKLPYTPPRVEVIDANDRFRAMQVELVELATASALKHGFQPEELEVEVRLRMPAQAEYVELALVKAVIGDCEGCGLPYAGCRNLMKDVEGRPCCRDCEHLSTGPDQ